jgi:metallo-beta-lactamase family protein
MLSAHADADELMRWLKGFQRPPKRVFVASSSEAFRVRIARELGWPVEVPLQGQSHAL